MNLPIPQRIGLLLLALSFPFFPAGGDDVYNFYFQKAPGPVTVNQGGPAKASPTEKAAAPTSGEESDGDDVESSAPTPTPPKSGASSIAVAPPPPQKPGHYKWQLTLGRSQVVQGIDQPGYHRHAHYNAYGAAAKYSFNRYVGIDAGLIISSNGGQISLGDAFQANAGVSIIPLHLQLFGFELLEVGILAGFLTASVGPNPSDRAVKAYTGIETNINFSEQLALTTRYKMYDGVDFGHGLVGLSYRF